MRYPVFALALWIAAVGTVTAGEFEKGDNEVGVRLSYSDTDFGSMDGFDFGSTKTTDVSLAYGWFVTRSNEFGLVAAYSREKVDGGDFFEDITVDGTRLGAFYNYNFKTQGILTPYVGAVIATLGGDLGDAYNFQYAAEVGLKIYPFDHGGISIGLGYSEFSSDIEGQPDANGLNLGIGLLLRY